MVCRLIQQHEAPSPSTDSSLPRRPQQQLCQSNTHLPASAELGAVPVVLFSGKSQAAEHFRDSLVHIPATRQCKFFLCLCHVRSSLHISLHHGLLSLIHPCLDLAEVRHGTAHFLVDSARGMLKGLGKVPDFSFGRDDYLSGINHSMPTQGMQQRALASAIGPHKPPALSWQYTPRYILEQIPVPCLNRDIVNNKDCPSSFASRNRVHAACSPLCCFQLLCSRC
mmetsp:Transcript_1979/g.5024  ORF Transcript_1979/g.5024 Transcript_1979/m.5024 type:complete len:224 (+) Transcript_1979:1842-2513(+)